MRSYGTVNGIGIGVTERDTLDPVVPGRFGAAIFVGTARRGDPGKAIKVISPKATERSVGRKGGDYSLRSALDAYWNASGGAGYGVGVRVTDGTETQAQITLYSRHLGLTGLQSDNYGDIEESWESPVAVMTVKAKDGGSWGGRLRQFAHPGITDANVSGVEVDLGTEMLPDAFAGGKLVVYAASYDYSGKEYTIESNDAAGVITLEPGAKLERDLLENATSPYTVVITQAEERLTKADAGIGVSVGNGSTRPSTEFSLDLWLDGVKVVSFPNLSMDTASENYFVSKINNDPRNTEITVADLLDPLLVRTQYHRPANLVRVPTAKDTQTITWLPYRRGPAVGAARAAVIAESTEVTSGSIHPMPGRLKFTYSLADTAWLVTFESLIFDGFEAVSLGEVGDNSQDVNVLWTSLIPSIPSVRYDVTAAPTDGDYFTVDILPPVGLSTAQQAEMRPNIDDLAFTSYKVRSSTYKSATADSGDPSAVATLGTVATCNSGDGTFEIVVDTSDALDIEIDGRGLISIVLDAGVARTATQIAGEINAAFLLSYPGTLEAPASVTGDAITLTSPGGFDGFGPSSIITVGGTANDVLAFPVLTRGTIGKAMHIQYPQPLTGGYDGLAPTYDRYVDVFSVDSPLEDIVEDRLGACAVLVPGVAHPDTGFASLSNIETLYRSITEYVETKGYVALLETPMSLDTEFTIINWWNDNVGRSDNVAHWVPSFAYVPHPTKAGLEVLDSVIPDIAGLYARVATQNAGYHKPAAGVERAILRRVLRLPDGFKKFNLELLTPGGHNTIVKKGNDFVVWGAGTIYENPRYRQLTVRWQMNHYIHYYLDFYDWVVFRLNDQETWSEIYAVSDAYFEREWAKRVLTGARKHDAYTLKIDADNNPAVEQEAGNAHLEASFRFTNFIERFLISVGPAGVIEA